MAKPMKGSAEESYARATLWLGLSGAIVIALTVLGFVGHGKQDDPVPSTPSATVSPQIGSQGGLWDRFPQECKVEGQIATECLEAFSLTEREAMRCLTEDGNQDGIPCIWINPRTGTLWYNDGSNR